MKFLINKDKEPKKGNLADFSNFEDKKLLELILSKKDDSAFKILYNRYKVKIYRYIRFTYPRMDDQEILDVIQDVFVEIHYHLPSLKDKHKFKPWCFTIAKFIAYRYWKKNQKSAKVEYSESTVYANSQHHQTHKQHDVNKMDLKNSIRKLQKSLSKEMKEIFAMRFLNGMKYQEIADSLGCSLRKVKYKATELHNEFENIIK